MSDRERWMILKACYVIVIWYYWVVLPIKAWRHWLHTWCHELCDLKRSWRNYGYFGNESRSVLIGFCKCEIFSLKDSLERKFREMKWKTKKRNTTTAIPWKKRIRHAGICSLEMHWSSFPPCLRIFAVFALRGSLDPVQPCESEIGGIYSKETGTNSL